MKYKIAFRLALRAIGVLLLFEHLPVILGRVLEMIWINGEGYGTFAFSFRDVLIVMRERESIGHLLVVVGGLYLLFGGRWITNRAISSSKPYCLECGCELTGNGTSVCPECGTANPALDSAPPVKRP